jgi:hypothetical protein
MNARLGGGSSEVGPKINIQAINEGRSIDFADQEPGGACPAEAESFPGEGRDPAVPPCRWAPAFAGEQGLRLHQGGLQHHG